MEFVTPNLATAAVPVTVEGTSAAVRVRITIYPLASETWADFYARIERERGIAKYRAEQLGYLRPKRAATAFDD